MNPLAGVQINQPTSSQQKCPAKQTTGGGGAATFHGIDYHLKIAIILILRLKELKEKDPKFQYTIELEKSEYGKFDDIVLRYKKSGGKWIEICIQCKHGEEKVAQDGTITVKNVNASDFVSGKNKNFSLVEYYKSFCKITSEHDNKVERYFVIISNRKYNVDEGYSWLETTAAVDLDTKFSDILSGDGLQFKRNNSLNTVLNSTDRKVISNFCSKFTYIYDNNNLDNVIREKLRVHCDGDMENMDNLLARLYLLVLQMYGKTIAEPQKEIESIFSPRNESLFTDSVLQKIWYTLIGAVVALLALKIGSVFFPNHITFPFDSKQKIAMEWMKSLGGAGRKLAGSKQLASHARAYAIEAIKHADSLSSGSVITGAAVLGATAVIIGSKNMRMA